MERKATLTSFPASNKIFAVNFSEDGLYRAIVINDVNMVDTI